MDNDFFTRKVTQSQYRGGGATQDAQAVYLDLSLTPLSLTNELDKDNLKSKIRAQSKEMISYLLDESFHSNVQESAYLQKIYTQLEL